MQSILLQIHSALWWRVSEIKPVKAETAGILLETITTLIQFAKDQTALSYWQVYSGFSFKRLSGLATLFPWFYSVKTVTVIKSLLKLLSLYEFIKLITYYTTVSLSNIMFMNDFKLTF